MAGVEWPSRNCTSISRASASIAQVAKLVGVHMGDSSSLRQAPEHHPDGVGGDGLAMLGEEELAWLFSSQLDVSLQSL